MFFLPAIVTMLLKPHQSRAMGSPLHYDGTQSAFPTEVQTTSTPSAVRSISPAPAKPLDIQVPAISSVQSFRPSANVALSIGATPNPSPTYTWTPDQQEQTLMPSKEPILSIPRSTTQLPSILELSKENVFDLSPQEDKQTFSPSTQSKEKYHSSIPTSGSQVPLKELQKKATVPPSIQQSPNSQVSTMPSLTPQKRGTPSPSTAAGTYSFDPTGQLNEMSTTENPSILQPRDALIFDQRDEASQTPTGNPTPFPSLVLTSNPTLSPSMRAPSSTPSTSNPTLKPSESALLPPTPVPSQLVLTPDPLATSAPTADESELTLPTQSPSPGGSASPGPTVVMPSSVPTTAPTTAPTTSYPTMQSDIEFFVKPERKWSVTLNNTGTRFNSYVGRGNGVTLSPDDSLLYITLSDGRLEVLSASNGAHLWTYQPDQNENKWEVTCQSTVYFGDLEGIGQYAAYAIVDNPPVGTTDDYQSRIVAVSHGRTNKHLWTSPPIPGIIQGTPVITRKHLPGRFIFVTHNVDSASDAPIGYFSILDATDSAAIYFSEASADLGGVNSTYPYTPLGVSHFPRQGNFPEGFDSDNDVVVWITSINGGFSSTGYLRAFQLPALYSPLDGIESLSTVMLRRTAWSSVAAPEISSDGLSIYPTAFKSQLRGWYSKPFHRPASWATALSKGQDGKTPIKNSASLSKDQRRFYVSSAGLTFAAVDSQSGRVLWEVGIGSEIMSKAVVSPDDRRVYAIQSLLGIVVCYNSFSGDIEWVAYCSYDQACPMEDVEAAFSLSRNGLSLYYASLNGQVSALQLGTSLAPTAAPTDMPTERPSVTTDSPTSSPKPSEFPTAVFVPSTFEPTTDETATSPAPTFEFQFERNTPWPTFFRTSSSTKIQVHHYILLIAWMVIWFWNCP